jgi:hypothetical protein
MAFHRWFLSWYRFGFVSAFIIGDLAANVNHPWWSFILTGRTGVEIDKMGL